MKKYTIVLLDEVAEFYSLIAEKVGYNVEEVISDMLLRVAGQLSLQELNVNKNNIKND